jgi:drug/metabolite transporter (DMT)-like permease
MRGHLALIISSTIFGFSFWILKGIMPVYFNPEQIIFLRILVSLILFWLTGAIFFREKVDWKDLPRLALCSLLGVSVNQIMFIEGVNYTTPVNASFIQLINPVLVVIFAAIIIKEKLTVFKMAGVIFGIIGTVMLITYGSQLSISNLTFRGDIFILINASVYAFFLIVIKPVMNKYNVITIMKWVFLFGAMVALPYTYSRFHGFSGMWLAAPLNAKVSLLYVVIFSTFVTYILISYALRKIEAGVASYYIYIQPVIVVVVGIWMGNESLNMHKIISASLIFTGVYFVSKKEAVQ